MHLYLLPCNALSECKQRFGAQNKLELEDKFLSFLCADAGHAVCLCGAVQEESWPSLRAAGHNQQLCMKDAAGQQSTQPVEGASPDMFTVDLSCSYISSSTPCTIHDKVANTNDGVWVGGEGFNGKPISYLLTCFVSYCYFKCFYKHWNAYKGQSCTWLIDNIDVNARVFFLFFFFYCGFIKMEKNCFFFFVPVRIIRSNLELMYKIIVGRVIWNVFPHVPVCTMAGALEIFHISLNGKSMLNRTYTLFIRTQFDFDPFERETWLFLTEWTEARL